MKRHLHARFCETCHAQYICGHPVPGLYAVAMEQSDDPLCRHATNMVAYIDALHLMPKAAQDVTPR